MRSKEKNLLPPDPTDLRERIRRLGLHGLLARWSEMGNAEWLARLCDIEEQERHKRSLERRLRFARIGSFKSMSDFDWKWPQAIQRDIVEELFSLDFIAQGLNAILIGPNGVGKTMMLRNLGHQALLQGHTVRFATASDMLSDLAAQDSSTALRRRLGRYCRPKLLCIDELGYLSYDSRYADLLFEVVTRRYEERRSIVLSTNKPFSEWAQVFPNAACVVTLVDRLVHRAEIIEIRGDSYRLKEAKERTAAKAKSRTLASAP